MKETVHFVPAKNKAIDVLGNVAAVRNLKSTRSYKEINIFLGPKGSEEENQYMNSDEMGDKTGPHQVYGHVKMSSVLYRMDI